MTQEKQFQLASIGSSFSWQVIGLSKTENLIEHLFKDFQEKLFLFLTTSPNPFDHVRGN